MKIYLTKWKLYWNTVGQGRISEGIMSFWVGFAIGALAVGYALKMVLEATK